jgi:hypothetical protein
LPESLEAAEKRDSLISAFLDEALKAEMFTPGTSTSHDAARTWPGLVTATAYLSTKVKAPTMPDVRKLKQLFGYIKNNRDKKLRIAPTTLQVAAWADASFTVHPDAKSHTGYVIGFDGFSGLILAKSKKQKIVTRSTAESELVACDEALMALLSARRKM